MSLIEVNNLCFNYSDKDLFNNISFRLLKNEHIVILGNNGVGKSTFLKILAKNLIPDKGKVDYLNNIKVSYLDQYLRINEDLNVKSYIYDTYSYLYEKEKILNNFYKELELNYSEKLLNTISNIQEELVRKGFYDIELKVNNIIKGLGINFNLDIEFKKLSGGQRVKVFLSKILLDEPDVMLLDEPTNFLDVEHVNWLKKYLKEYKGSFIVISHYYEFVNEIANIIYELGNKELIRYKGNLDFYLKEKNIRMQDYIKKYENQKKYIEKTKDFINKNITRASTSNRAKSRLKSLDKIKILEKPSKEFEIKFNIKFTKNNHLKVLEIKDLAIGYNNIILDNINLLIKRNEKIVITGKNGVGKTTFLKTITSRINKLKGEFKFSDETEIMYFSQEFEEDENLSPLDYLNIHFPYINIEDKRKVLSNLSINKDLFNKKISTLSGGEKAKVRLAKLSMEKGNFLIMDEPTNHLDQTTKKILLKKLKEFPGNVIIVSHDKDFYNQICDINVSF